MKYIAFGPPNCFGIGETPREAFETCQEYVRLDDQERAEGTIYEVHDDTAVSTFDGRMEGYPEDHPPEMIRDDVAFKKRIHGRDLEEGMSLAEGYIDKVSIDKVHIRIDGGAYDEDPMEYTRDVDRTFVVWCDFDE